MTVEHNGINVVRNGRAVWEPNPCGTPHHNYPETRCTEPAGHYRPDRDPHAGPFIIDGREVGAAAWDEPKESSMTDQTAIQATEPQSLRPRLSDAIRGAARTGGRGKAEVDPARELGRYRDWLADQVARCEAADQVGGVPPELRVSPHNGMAAGMRSALLGLDRMVEALNQAKGEPAAGVREVRIVVQAPSDENAGRWAETIRDLVVGEYGDSMRLEVTILPGGRS